MYTPALQRLAFLRFLLPWIAGIWFQYRFEPIYLWQSCVLAALPFLLLSRLSPRLFHRYRLRWATGVGLLLLFTAGGAWSTALKQESLRVAFPAGVATYRLAIVEAAQTRNGRTRLTAEVNNQTRAYLYLPPGYPVDSLPQSGVSATVETALRPVRNYNNAASFDYRRFCLQRGVTHAAFLSPQTRLTLAPHPATPIQTALRMRTHIVQLIHQLSLSAEHTSILIGLLLGDKQSMDPEIVERFRILGLAHLLAVSGLHVGILLAFLLLCFRSLSFSEVGRWLQYLLPIALLGCYAAITAFTPSVVRAVVMSTIYCVGVLLRKEKNELHTLFVTAFLMLVVNPFNLFDVGFQMSFAAVLFILLINAAIRPSLIAVSRNCRAVVQTVAVCTAAQLGVLPLSLLYFGTIQPLFLLSNLILVPVVAPLLILGIATVAISALHLEYAFPFTLLKGCLVYLSTIAEWMERHFRGFTLQSHWNGFHVVVIYILLLLLVHFIATRSAKSLLAAMAAVAILIVIV